VAAGSRNDTLVQIMLAVFRINGRLLEQGDAMVAPLDLTSARWQVLGAISLEGRPLTAPQVAQAMGITRQGALKQLDRMEEEGLVARQPNPRHERSPLYTLTARGEAVYAQAMALNERWVADLAQGFKNAELDTTLTTLSRLYERLAGPVPTNEKRS